MTVHLWKYFYCVTLSIPAEMMAEWKEWMQNKHIPDVLASHCFINDLTELNEVTSEGDKDNKLCSFEIRYYSEKLELIGKYMHTAQLGGERKKEYQASKYGPVTTNAVRKIGQVKPYNTSKG